MPELYTKIIVCFSISPGSKVRESIDIGNLRMTKTKMAAKKNHGTLVHFLNIDISSLDILTSLKSRSH